MTEPHDELQPEERAIISTLERSKGRDLTEQEINPALDHRRERPLVARNGIAKPRKDSVVAPAHC